MPLFFPSNHSARICVLGTLAILLSISPPRGCVLAQVPAANRWGLDIPILDADLSPDDRLLAVTTTSVQHPKREQPADESVSIWDYRQQKKIVEARVGTSPLGMQPGPVRFTSDGAIVVTADAHTIHVFDSATLKLLRDIEPPVSADFFIRELETSPISHVAIITIEERYKYGGSLFIYDLDNGHEIARRLGTGPINSVAWKPDGTEFAMAFNDYVDVFQFGIWSHPAATIHGEGFRCVALSNDRIYGVQGNSTKSAVFRVRLKIVVFNLKGQQKKSISLSQKDIHDSISYANGRLLANSGKVDVHFDWLDMQSFSGGSVVQIAVWNSDTRSLIYTSESLQIHPGAPVFPGVRMRLSRTAKMALVLDRNVRLFEIP